MATATPPVSPHATYPDEAVGKLFAPPEAEVPADKLRRLLREAQTKGSFLHTAGAYDAFTAAIMTRVGFKALYGSGWQLAATKSMFPDIGIYASHDMLKLVHEMWMGIEGARNTHYFDTEGRELLESPPAFVDMEAGFGGPTQTFTLATELIRARAAGVHLENQDPSNRTCGHIVNVGKQKRNKVLVPRRDWLAKLKAIKAAAQVTGTDVVIIARTDSIDGALPGKDSGGVKMAIEDAWEAAELGVDVIWPEFNNTQLEQPQEFAEGVRKHYPNQMLGFNLSPSLYFGKDKKAGTMISNQQLADLGFTLQFSTLFNFRTAGMALEKGLRKFLNDGLDALADLQNEEEEIKSGSPLTKMHQKFAGMNRWLILEQVLSGEK
ncbi:MAG: isocitrate lyase/phosphoenolpyruvate mutase family protein [Gemmatimonadales bacterium]|nr:isocitrate lyase/phosphoenolpyruvate mutase family protein [Gemmatimonadales bacterium]MDQ3426909.1 isocitrate lyase/phosphoenolpyruvate mutase family protein [Gemmatimonadota bacterium]